MTRGDFPSHQPSLRLALCAVFVYTAASLPALAMPQAEPDVPPDTTPVIQQVDPGQGAVGAHVPVVIQGSNFAVGAYVASVSAAIHVDSSKRISATHLEAELTVSASAQPSTVSLLVSNPSSRAAEAAFTILAGPAPPVPAAPQTPPAPAPAPGGEQKPSGPGSPAVPATPAPAPAPAPSVQPAGPEVTAIEPSQVEPGFDVDLKITGKNFVQGTKVSFANPGIRVFGITNPSDTEFTAHIKVARDATPGAGSAFVSNPDDREVEVPFEVVAKTAAKTTVPPAPAPTGEPPAPGTPAPPPVPPPPASPDTQRYEAFHLGSPAEAVHARGKVKGALVVTPGTIEYQEAGKTLITIAVSDVKEIKTSSVVPDTFHITLNSGKVYHFAPGSLRPADARTLVDSLREALPSKSANP